MPVIAVQTTFSLAHVVFSRVREFVVIGQSSSEVVAPVPVHGDDHKHVDEDHSTPSWWSLPRRAARARSFQCGELQLSQFWAPLQPAEAHDDGQVLDDPLGPAVHTSETNSGLRRGFRVQSHQQRPSTEQCTASCAGQSGTVEQRIEQFNKSSGAPRPGESFATPPAGAREALTLGPSPRSSSGHANGESHIYVGAEVVLSGLKSKPVLNGSRAVVTELLSNNRVGVKVCGDPMAEPISLRKEAVQRSLFCFDKQDHSNFSFNLSGQSTASMPQLGQLHRCSLFCAQPCVWRS